MKFASSAGRERVVEKLSSMSVSCPFLPENLTEDSLIDVVCTKCSSKVPVRIADLMRDHLACMCNGKMRWNSEDGRRRLMNIIKESRFVIEHQLPLYLTETTEIAMQCTKCNLAITTTARHLNRGDVGCLCSNTSEQKVVDLVKATLVSEFANIEWEVVPQYKDASLVGVNNRKLKFDCAVLLRGTPVLFVEVDGPQHFHLGSYFVGPRAEQDHKNCIEHDFRKEIFAMEYEVPMLRLLSRSVYFDILNWRQWIVFRLRLAMRHTLEAEIHRLGKSTHYTTGAYAERRMGTVLQRV
jgi:hypothetical protein